MATSPNDQLYTLARDGDSRERRWADEILKDFGSYEKLWRAHIVPLSFRSRDPKNYYLRPSVSECLLNLADSAYATLFHLSECHAWAQRLHKILEMLKKPDAISWPARDKAGIVPSEALYCFFSHAFSVVDTSVHFAKAVNGILSKYGRGKAEVFIIQTSPTRSKTWLESWQDPQSEEAYKQLTRTIAGYRNMLVHEKPLFVLTRRIPLSHCIDEWSGLTAISKATQDQRRFWLETEWVTEILDPLLPQMRNSLEGVWRTALTALEPLLTNDRYLNDQRLVSRKDKDLTLKKIKDFISYTRVG